MNINLFMTDSKEVSVVASDDYSFKAKKCLQCGKLKTDMFATYTINPKFMSESYYFCDEECMVNYYLKNKKTFIQKVKIFFIDLWRKIAKN